MNSVEPSPRNPNKALLTVNKSGTILIANENAAELLECQVSGLFAPLLL